MVIGYEDLAKIREENKDKKIVLLKGSFDLFHSGHLKMINIAKAQGDILCVIVKSNSSVSAKGQTRPIIDEQDRASIVDSIKAVDYTLIADKLFDISKLKETIEIPENEEWQCKLYYYVITALRPDILVQPAGITQPKTLLDLYYSLSTQIVEVVREKDGISTTSIINRVQGKGKNEPLTAFTSVKEEIINDQAIFRDFSEKIRDIRGGIGE